MQKKYWSIMGQFEFNRENLEKSNHILSKYPEKRSAIIPLFYLAQKQNNGWLSEDCIDYVAKMVNVSYIKAYEVATFYTMFNLKPVGKYHLQICGTTPCWLVGSDEVKDKIMEVLSIKESETTKDGKFTLTEVECLGACVNGPVIQINNDYYENLNKEKIVKILKNLQKD